MVRITTNRRAPGFAEPFHPPLLLSISSAILRRTLGSLSIWYRPPAMLKSSFIPIPDPRSPETTITTTARPLLFSRTYVHSSSYFPGPRGIEHPLAFRQLLWFLIF